MKNNSYLIEGQDYISIKQKITSIIKDNNFNDAIINEYDLEEVLLDNALEDLDTYGLFSDKKVIIIRNYDKLKTEENKESLEHLLKYIDNPSSNNLLLITTSSIDERKKINKTLKQKTNYIICQFNQETYIKELLDGYKYDKSVINKLMKLCNNDITKLSSECLKLKDYCSNKKITEKDVEDLVVQKLGDSSEIVFSLIRSISSRNISESLLTYKELLNYNIEPLGIIALLDNQLRLIYQVKELSNNKLSNEEIATILGEKSPYRIKKIKELINYYTQKELLTLFIKLSDIDLKIKTSDENPNFLIEQFILNLK